MPRCLIVDDDRDGREGFAEYLRAFGFEVSECADAESAWERLATERPDIVLLDLQLPRVSGWDLVSRLRQSPAYSSLPVVAFSACVTPDDQQHAAEVGCDVFITKPATPTDVLRVLKQLLRSRGSDPRPSGTTDASS
jgi:CheY-like chemotaxis protein